MTDSVRAVLAIVVNHNSGPLLERAVRSLLDLDWPVADLDVVVVDNASSDDSLAAVTDLDRVTTIGLETNLGFGGAINRALAARPQPDAVLLLNPDAWMEPDALATLAGVLNADPTIAGAGPRILFDREMTEVEITSEAHRDVIIDRADLDGHDVTAALYVVEGGERRPRRDGGAPWHLDEHARLHVPHGRELTLHLRASRAGAIEVRAGSATITARVGRTESPLTTPLAGPGQPVIQNDGSSVAADGTGANHHFHQAVEAAPSPDGATPIETFAWCGAAVLLRHQSLADTGNFAEPLFLYYEDTDLAWRGRAAGYRHVVVPQAIVWHRHSASTGQGQAITEIHQHRNRVLMMLRNAPLGPAVRALLGLAATTASLGLRVLVGRVKGPSRDVTQARYRWRSLRGAVALAPWALRTRRALGSQARRSRREVFAERNLPSVSGR